MGFSRGEDLMKRIRAGSKESHEESAKRKDDFGSFGSFLTSDLPVPLFRDKSSAEGTSHCFDIIPYLAGSNDPNRKEGASAYVLDIYVHMNEGAADDQIVCPTKNYKKPCPICEELKAYLNKFADTAQYDKKVVEALRPKRRCLFYVWVHNTEESTKIGLQIYHVSHWWSEKRYLDMGTPKIVKGRSIGGRVFYADVDEGKSIAFNKKGGRNNVEYYGFEFIDRDEGEEVPVSMVEQAAENPLDELINILSYDEIEKIHFEGEEKQEADDGPSENQETEDDYPSDPYQDDPDDGAYRESLGTEEKSEEKTKSNEDGRCPHGLDYGIDIENEGPECGKCEEYTNCAHTLMDAQQKAAEKPNLRKAKTKPETETKTETKTKGRRRDSEKSSGTKKRRRL